mgnify:CR=1 FL=1
MHVLIIPSWYPAFTGDIGGSFFREQALALQNYGHKVGVIYPQVESLRNIKKYIVQSKGLSFEMDEMIPTYRWYYLNSTPRLNNYNSSKWVSYGLKLFNKYIEKYGKPDIIHVHSMLNGAFLANEIKNKYNIPFIITEHSTAYARGLISHNQIESLKPILFNSSMNIAVSKEFVKLLNDIFKVNSWNYIPNIVNRAFLKKDISLVNNSFKYISVCLLDPKKKVENLIYAFKEVVKIYPNLLLEIGGDGPEKRKLESLVVDLKIVENVIFLGKLTRNEVREKISDSSAFVLSSEYETFGVVLVEALALGKPVIATMCGGPESIVVAEVGVLVEKNSIAQLAKAMIEMFESYHKYDPNLIKKYCEDNFGEKIVINT